MGYNSWYDLMCSPYMNETTLHATADAMVEKGLVKLGYNYLNLDDCYITSRDASGVLQPDPKTFSSGMKSLGDYAHSKGMKFVSAAGLCVPALESDKQPLRRACTPTAGRRPAAGAPLQKATRPRMPRRTRRGAWTTSKRTAATRRATTPPPSSSTRGQVPA